MTVALAGIEDFELIAGPAADEDRVMRLIEMASDSVLAEAHGQQIVAGSSTEVLQPWSGLIWLPQRPVTAVTEVAVDGEVVDPSRYRFTRGAHGRPALLVARRGGADVAWRSEVTVTYDHGWDPVPGQVRAAVATMVAQVLGLDGGPARSQRQTGPFMDAYRDPQTPDMAPTGPTKSMLDTLCRVRSPASVPVVRDLL